MDRKPQVPRYSSSKNYNANYISQPVINYDDIDSTYANFSTGEYEEILQIIQSNKILNFRNSEGETLIHAILKNPSSSLTEANVLEIIQLLVHKNVSINAMNTYNQIPLHLASKKGYYDVIDYLISLKSDFDKIDNYGNAPIHYLVDNFITDCKKGEYFKESNKKLKSVLKNDNYDKMTENFMVLSLINKIINLPKNKDNSRKLITKTLPEIINKYKFFKVLDIQKSINSKKLEIEDIFKKHSSTPTKTQINSLLKNLIKDLNDTIYKDLKIENKQDSSSQNEFINDDTYINIQKKIKSELLSSNNKFDNKLSEYDTKLNELEALIEDLFGSIISLHKIMHFSIYVTLAQNVTSEIKKISEKIEKIFFYNVPDKTKIYDFDGEIETSLIFSENVINNNKKMKFIRTYEFEPFITPGYVYNELNSFKLNFNYDNATGQRLILKLPSNKYLNSTETDILLNQFITRTLGTNPNFKYRNSILLNIISYIKKYVDILKISKNLIDIKDHNFFYLNYINEIVINICNNLVNFNNNYITVPIKNIIMLLIDFERELQTTPIDNSGTDPSKITSEVKQVLGMLLSQLADPVKDKYDVEPKSRTHPNNDVDELNKINDIDFSDVTKKLYDMLNENNIYIKINNIYKKLLEINKNNNELIQSINTNYSLKYLDKFLNYTKNNFTSTAIDDFATNKFYPNEGKFPSDLLSYQTKYFPTEKFDLTYIKNIKNDLLKKYNDYDFNNIYKRGALNNFKMTKVVLNNVSYELDFDGTLVYDIPNDPTNFYTGYAQILYDDYRNLDNVDDKYLFYKKKTKIKINNEMKYYYINTDLILSLDKIPIISLEHVKEIIQLICHKIIESLDSKSLNSIINLTKKKLKEANIPEKIFNNINQTLDFLIKPENVSLLKRVITDKLIIFINTLITIQSNQEINEIIQELLEKNLAEPYTNLSDKTILQEISKNYKVQLEKYTIEKMIPKLLENSGKGSLSGIKIALNEINTIGITKPTEKKLLLEKCISLNKIDLLKQKLLNKINLRTLDRNGNTILNRLIDQYNDYAIEKLLELDKDLPTYKNNRGWDSKKYLFDVLKTINKAYSWELLNKRIKSYESDLQIWIKSEGGFGNIELDESKRMVYNIILNSLFLFNEYLWLNLLKAPNGWKYEDKTKLKEIIKNKLGYTIEENLLIKSLTDADKTSLINNSEIIILNNRLDELINNLEKEIKDLEESNKQMNEEKTKTTSTMISGIDKIISDNDIIIKSKQAEIISLKTAKIDSADIKNKFDDKFKDIKNAILINDMNINWTDYNILLKEKLWNYYLSIINMCNEKNNKVDLKYVSYYNFALLNIDYDKLSDDEITVLMNYYTKVVNNIYGDFYDLEKYEDSEFNYVNNTILNIIYLNVVGVIAIEMYSAIVGYNINKYSNNKIVARIINDYKDPVIYVLMETIVDLLKNIVWEKLNLKNPNYSSNYIDYNTYSSELKIKIQAIFTLEEKEDDIEFINNILKFYKGLVENLSYNIYNEIINLLNDMKKNSLLFKIYYLINKK
jgi:hypothetical protein